MQDTKQSIDTARFVYARSSYEQTGTIVVAVLVSVILHVVFFGLCIGLSQGNLDETKKPRVINVDLMYFPVPERKPEIVKEKTPVQETKQKKRVTKKSTPPKEKPVSKKRVSQKNTDKKIVKPADILKKAPKKIEKEVEKPKPDPLATRISQLKKEILRHDNLADKQNDEEVIADKNADSQSRVANIRDRYFQMARYTIRDNWTYPKHLAESADNPEVHINVTIMQNGEIKDTWFVKRSGNQYFDRSVSAAVMRSNPLPPFPPGLTDASEPVTFVFTLKDFMDNE